MANGHALSPERVTEIWKGLKWFEIDEEVYKAVLASAKERFEDVSSESESITNKAIAMIALVPAFGGYILARLVDNTHYLIIVAAVVLIIIEAVLLYKLIKPKTVRRRGIAPEASIHKDLNESDNSEFQIELTYFTAISVIADNTAVMTSLNEERIKYYGWAVGIFLMLFGLSVYLTIGSLPTFGG
jgi:putative Mn2+ efflux pump MntP